MNQKARPEGRLVMQTHPRGNDLNPNGTVFGGWVLSIMDAAGAMVAIKAAKGRISTVGVEGVHFFMPLWHGDVACIYGSVVKLGTTSVTVKLEVWAMRKGQWDLIEGYEDLEKCADGLYTFVAIDDQGKPRPINPPSA
jgi:acyl-CoA thioesterase YciA